MRPLRVPNGNALKAAFRTLSVPKAAFRACLPALLFAIAACGQAADQATPAGQPTPTAPVSESPSNIVEPTPPLPPSTKPVPPGAPAPPTATTPPEGAVLLPKSQADTSALPDYYVERNVWSTNGGRTLALNANAPTPCTGVTARIVEETDQLVRIAVNPMATPQGGQPDGPSMCAQVITPQVISVDLKAPLGDRKVIVTEGP